MDHFDRPLSPADAPDGYAATVSGTSMEPRYHSGETIYLHTDKPVTVGSYVLVQLKGATEGEAPFALIARLVGKTGSTIALEQFNPAKRFDIAPNDIVSMHRIVGSGESPSEESAMP